MMQIGPHLILPMHKIICAESITCIKVITKHWCGHGHMLDNSKPSAYIKCDTFLHRNPAHP